MNKTYFKFKRFNEVWILPVYINSVMHSNPENSYNWDKNIEFVAEVTEEEYNAQFIPKKEYIQQELF